MTTAQIPQLKQSQALADAISRAIELGDSEATRPLGDLRVVALPDNQATVADVSWDQHPPVARALRLAAEDIRAGQPEVAGVLDDIAGSLDQQLRQRLVNGGGAGRTSWL